MIIKSDSGNLICIVFSYLLYLLLGGLLVFGSGSNSATVIIGVLLWLAGSWFCIRWYISVFREITFGADGIYVCLFTRKTMIPWDSVIISYESEESFPRLRTQYKAVLTFPLKRFKKPKYMSPSVYCILFHPYSYVFLNFYEDAKTDGFPNVYAVKKEAFRSFMEDLGFGNLDF